MGMFSHDNDGYATQDDRDLQKRLDALHLLDELEQEVITWDVGKREALIMISRVRAVLK